VHNTPGMFLLLQHAMYCAMLIRVASHTDLIGSRESCRILQIDKSTLSRKVADGSIKPASKMPGRNGAYVFHRRDVEALRDTMAAKRAEQSA